MMLVMLVMMVVTSCPRGDELSEAADRSVVLSMTVMMMGSLLSNLDQWRRTGRAWEEGGGVVEGEEGHDLVPAPWWVKPKPQLLLVLS